jgi:dTDP-4-dehydrorhamnose reductase
MNERRILVIGSDGLVGSALMRELSKTYLHVYGASHKAIEIRNSIQTAEVINLIDPEVVFLCAALPHVDYCEEHPEVSNEFNIIGPSNVVDVCKKDRIVVFYSSSYVFDGKLVGRGYLPHDQVCPVNIYGKHKVEAEKRIMYANPNNLIVRTVGVIGKESKQKNFGYQILGSMQIKRVIYVPLDQEMNPILSDDLAAVSMSLVEKKQSGIHHVSGNICKSKFELATDIAKAAGLTVGYIVGKMTEDMKQPAIRPLNGCLDVEGLPTVGIKIPDYNDMIERFLDDH